MRDQNGRKRDGGNEKRSGTKVCKIYVIQHYDVPNNVLRYFTKLSFKVHIAHWITE